MGSPTVETVCRMEDIFEKFNLPGGLSHEMNEQANGLEFWTRDVTWQMLHPPITGHFWLQASMEISTDCTHPRKCALSKDQTMKCPESGDRWHSSAFFPFLTSLPTPRPELVLVSWFAPVLGIMFLSPRCVNFPSIGRVIFLLEKL